MDSNSTVSVILSGIQIDIGLGMAIAILLLAAAIVAVAGLAAGLLIGLSSRNRAPALSA